MGIFKWLANQINSEKSEEKKLLIDLREGIRWLGKAYLLIAFHLGTARSIQINLKSYLDNSTRWLQEAKNRTTLLIMILEKRNAPTYRKKSSLQLKDENLLALLLKAEKRLIKNISFLQHAKENILVSPLEIPPPDNLTNDYPEPIQLKDLMDYYKFLYKEIKKYKD